MNSNQLVLSTGNKVQLCPTPKIFICLTLKVRISIKPWSEELQHSIILNLEFEGPIQVQIVLTLLNSDQKVRPIVLCMKRFYFEQVRNFNR